MIRKSYSGLDTILIKTIKTWLKFLLFVHLSTQSFENIVIKDCQFYLLIGFGQLIVLKTLLIYLESRPFYSKQHFAVN